MKYVLKLFIIGKNPRSERARENFQTLFRYRKDCQTEIIDITANPEEAEKYKIIATPALVKETPLPPQRVIGDLSSIKDIKSWLGIEESK